MEIDGEHAVEAKCFQHLLMNCDGSSSSVLSRLNPLSESRDGMSKTQWVKELPASSKTAREFREKLEEHNALVQTGTREDGNGGTPLYELNEDRLWELFRDTHYYRKMRDLFVEAAYKEGKVYMKQSS